MDRKEKQTVDKRVLRTKRAIRNAFTELLAEKDLNFITVKDIAEHANINRKTFYNYYSGIYQVIEELENDLVNKFSDAFSNVDFRESVGNPRLIFDRIDSLICADIEFYGNLFTMDENLNLITKMTMLIKSKIKRTICSQSGLNDETADVALEFLISGMVSVYQMWFRSDRLRTISETSDIIGVMCFDGLKGVLRRPQR